MVHSKMSLTLSIFIITLDIPHRFNNANQKFRLNTTRNHNVQITNALQICQNRTIKSLLTRDRFKLQMKLQIRDQIIFHLDWISG